MRSAPHGAWLATLAQCPPEGLIAFPFDDLDAMTFEEWQKILSVNLTGPMLCIKAAAPVMRRTGGGRIVNIASVAGLAPSGSSIPYAVSKAGLIHLTRCMAVGLAPDILVNCVAPGYLEGTRATSNLDAADALLAAPGTAERVLAVMGTDDPYTPEPHLRELEAAGATVVRYEGAEHGFVHDPARPAHRADDAADAWRRAIAWLGGAP